MMTKARRRQATVTVLCAASACGLGPDLARANAGFGLNDGLADWTANGYAGEAAKAYDAGTAWTNPAGMVRLHSRFESDTSIDFIDPDVNFHGVQTFDNGSAPITAPQSEHGIDAAVAAATGTVISLSDRVKLGFAAMSPFASRLSWTPENYVGRYQDINSIPTNVQGIFSMAYAIDSHLSVGAGPIVSYFKDRQTHALALDQETASGGLISGNIGNLLDPSGADPIAQYRGDDLKVGYDVSALYQVTDDLRFGVNYHSAIYHRLQGYQTIFVPPAISQSLLAALVVPTLRSQIYDASSKVTLPGWVDTSGYWQVNRQWAVMANATWTNWSLFQHTEVAPEVPGQPVTTDIQYNFRDTVTAGVGVNYMPSWNRKLMLQTGVTYDESPVTDANRQGSLPDGDRVEIGVGATYKVSSRLALNIAYTHYFFPGSNTIDNGIGNQVIGGVPLAGTVTTPSGRLVGHYDLDNNALIVGVKSFF